MGTTPTYTLPYPELTDVANVPADMRELAEAVEAAVGTPTTTPRAARSKGVSQTLTVANTAYVLTYDVDEAGQSTSGIAYAGGVFTISRPGVYQVNAVQHFQAAAGTANLRLDVNAGAWALVSLPLSGNGSVGVQRSWRIVAGDTVTLRGSHSVANAVAYGAATRYSFVDITLVAP